MASAILFAVVVSVTQAITAGQQHAHEAQQRIAATLAAEELMGRLSSVPYADLPTWNGFTQAVGAMTDVAGQAMPDSFAAVGRRVSVRTSLQTVPGVDIRVRGRTVRIQAFDRDNRTLCDLQQFIPEPSS